MVASSSPSLTSACSNRLTNPSRYSFGGTRLGQGNEQAREF